MIVGVSRFLKVAHVVSCVVIIVLSSVTVPLCVLLWDTFRCLEPIAYNYVTLLPLVVGATSLVLFALSLVGVWAAVVASAGSFRIYMSSLIVVLVGKLLWMAMSSDLQLDFLLALEQAFEKNMERYQFQPSVMDNIQWSMKCCGMDSPEDWFILTGYIPSSCCYAPSTAHKHARCVVPEQLYLVPPTGCLRLIKNMPKQYYLILQLLFHACSIALVFSLCVSYFMWQACNQSKKENFRLKRNIIEGRSAYETEDNSTCSLLKRKICYFKRVNKNISRRSLFALQTKVGNC